MIDDATKIAKLEEALYDLEDIGEGFSQIQTDTWVQYTQPDAPSHFRNGVLRSVLDAEELPERIRDTIAHYDAQRLPFRWMITPSTRPANTPALLLGNGFAHYETLEALVADSANFPPPTPDDVEILEVDESLIEEWVHVNHVGFELPEAALSRFRAAKKRRLAEVPRREVTLLARVDGEPAAAGSFKLHDGFAHFSGAATTKAFQRRGLYRRLILERMARLRELGIRIVTNHARSTTSAPICKRLGFEYVCDFEEFIHEPASSAEDSSAHHPE